VSGIPAGWAWSFDKSAEVMDRCQGAVILALVKYQFGDDHLLPSEYAHYEGALALSKALPTLIISEDGTPDAGIVFQGGGQFIHRLRSYDVEQGGDDFLSAPQFGGMFERWADEVRERSRVFLGYCSASQPTADGIRSCRAGVFLFTKDDPLEGDEAAAAPRDNVVLEARFCIATRVHVAPSSSASKARGCPSISAASFTYP
jgi:hypothetical protein